MLIPSIDIRSGRAVQLRKGKEHVLTDDRDPETLVQLFNRYGEVALIDLDAALSQGDNLPLLKRLCSMADVRVGGGIRDVERARTLLRAGAKKIIIGTAANPEFLSQLPSERVMVALDHTHDGEVLDHGWMQGTGESLWERAERLAPYCSGYLCTFVDTEGTLEGLPLQAVEALRQRLPHPVTVAGGVSTTADAVQAVRLGVDVQVGMALYTGKLDLTEAFVQLLNWNKCPLLPTIVQNAEDGQVLMLAYSTPESLKQALDTGKGIYFSRSRQALWEKGATSGNSQQLLSCRADCDQDSLLFSVRQNGPCCHTGTNSCFGDARFSIPTLFNILSSRRNTLPEGSFTATLFKNREKLYRKLMEEAFEVTRSQSRDDFVWELSDTLFFLSMVAVDEGISWKELVAELGGRQR